MTFSPEGIVQRNNEGPKSDEERIAELEAAEAAESVSNAETTESEDFFSEEEMRHPESIGLERLLGDDFDAEAMEGMFSVWPTEVIRDGWNEYLEVSNNPQALEPLPSSLVVKLWKKIPGVGDSKAIFPIFLRFLQDHYAKQGHDGVITPDEAKKFHSFMDSMYANKRTL